ncbi:uncharacterized protein UV8b_04585 [Ustilaginoidea virens]|uniref:Thioesterase domain-containing protein n=1 Tax=Ustilaginoidea virens TaxID=1159556 RepID=A0A8E5HRJ7_USTVR|nr:uncharacterized protein UV8b_04585 [Ustilaginoidea virens]QUC20344.1 hypothetical protein UV8b_04585 [Ustilaginoidea virens]
MAQRTPTSCQLNAAARPARPAAWHHGGRASRAAALPPTTVPQSQPQSRRASSRADAAAAAAAAARGSGPSGQTAASGGAATPPPGHPAGVPGEGRPRRRAGRALGRGLLVVLFGLASCGAGAYASWRALSSRGMGFYSDAESLERFAPGEGEGEGDAQARQVEQAINAHPLVAELRRRGERGEVVESRPHMKMPRAYRARSLTGGALAGPGRVPVPAYAWVEPGGRSLVSVVFVGDDLCGHPGLVHGGFLATMLDEGLARCCFGALPHGVGVTANLTVDYRAPVPAGSYLVLRAETTRAEGRKAWVKGRIESLPAGGEAPVLYAEATALFVSPKFAAMLPKLA